MTTPAESKKSWSVLRIYLRRRGSKPGRGSWGRLFGRSLSYDLAERALEAGVTYATVTLGHAGFVPGAKRIVAGIWEVPPTTLLWGTVLLRLDGAEVSLRGVPA